MTSRNYSSREELVTNNRISSVVRSAIDVDCAGRCTVADNFIYVTAAPSQAVVRIDCEDNSVRDNYIHVTNGAVAAVVGIQFRAWGNSAVGNHLLFANASYAHLGIDAQQGDHNISGNFVLNESETPSNVGSKGIVLYNINNVCSGNYINAFDYGIDMTGADDSTVNGNFFYNNRIGVDISTCTKCSVSGNAFAGGVHHILSQSDSFTSDLTINANTFSGNSGHTIVARSLRRSIISNNKFTEDFKSASQSAIYLHTSSGTNYTSRNVINGNNITWGGNAGMSIYGIRENSPNDGPNLITGNLVLDATTAQISTQHASSVTADNMVT